MQNQKIYIQIAAYRDAELIPTIRDCLLKASRPDLLTFGIAQQDEPKNFLTYYDNDPRFKILKINYTDSRGACWARAKTNSLYDGEKYTLQIDSHMRFVDDWDRKMIAMREDLNDPAAVLSTYPAEYQPGQLPTEWKNNAHVIHTYNFKNGHTEQRPYTHPDIATRAKPYKGIHIAAGFIFGLGRIIEDVPYDPEFYFQGEETALAIRLFTHGYNIYAPHQLLLWHYYTRKDDVKHWSDDKDWGKKSATALDRLDCLLGRNKNYDLTKFGLGKVRTLKDFQNYSGIDYDRKILHVDTMAGKEPPVDLSDPSKWEIIKKTYSKFVLIEPTEAGPEIAFVGVFFKDASDHEIYRHDIKPETLQEIKSGALKGVDFSFTYNHPIAIPSIVIVWPYIKDVGWGKMHKEALR